MKKIIALSFCFALSFLCLYGFTEPNRPDIETHYGICEEKDGLFGSWNEKGEFVALDKNSFEIGDKVLSIIYYNPNNNICDDVIKVTHEKIVD